MHTTNSRKHFRRPWVFTKCFVYIKYMYIKLYKIYMCIYIHTEKRSFNSYMQKQKEKVFHFLFLSSCVTLLQKLQQGHSSKWSEDKMGCVSQTAPRAETHRTVEAGGRSASPTSLPKQGQLRQFAQDSIQLSFEYLQGWRLHSFARQPLPVLNHPHSKSVFSPISWDLPRFSLCPLPCTLPLGWGKSASIIFRNTELPRLEGTFQI